jgi:hypothetical protein
VESCASRIKDKIRPIRVFAVSIAVSVAYLSVSASLERLSAQDGKASGTMYPSKRMADGKQWMTRNLDGKTMPSYCYEGACGLPPVWAFVHVGVALFRLF